MSFDVVSLFTNVPEYLVIKSIERRWHQLHNKINLNLSEFCKVVKFILNNNYFQSNQKYYKQIFGSAMGNPISPVLSDIVMEDLESHCISRLNSKPLFYFRYVDDVLLCLHKDYIDETLKTFNNYDMNLQFTVETLQNNSISFLDMTLINKNNRISTNWYQKPTSSSRVINFLSKHPIQQKRNIIYNLTDRGIVLSDK